MKKLSRHFLVLFFILVPFSLQAEEPGPALWSWSDEDTTVYIFGTIHMMTDGVDWNTPKISGAFEKAETIIFEVGPEPTDPVQPLIDKHGLLPEGTKLYKILSAETYHLVRKNLKKIGAERNSLNNMQPWLVATFLAVQAAKKQGLLYENGVDSSLMEQAKAETKRIYGLETAESQFKAYSNLKMETQITFLEETLKQIEDLSGTFDHVRDAWLTGDLESLDAQLNGDWSPYPDLKQAVWDDRNEKWTERLVSMLEEPGTLFVVVGTLHLVGENNLISLLEKQGYPLALK